MSANGLDALDLFVEGYPVAEVGHGSVGTEEYQGSGDDRGHHALPTTRATHGTPPGPWRLRRGEKVGTPWRIMHNHVNTRRAACPASPSTGVHPFIHPG